MYRYLSRRLTQLTLHSCLPGIYFIKHAGLDRSIHATRFHFNKWCDATLPKPKHGARPDLKGQLEHLSPYHARTQLSQVLLGPPSNQLPPISGPGVAAASPRALSAPSRPAKSLAPRISELSATLTTGSEVSLTRHRIGTASAHLTPALVCFTASATDP